MTKLNCKDNVKPHSLKQREQLAGLQLCPVHRQGISPTAKGAALAPGVAIADIIALSHQDSSVTSCSAGTVLAFAF